MIATAEGARDPGILCNEYQAGFDGECLDDFDCLSFGSLNTVARCSSAGLCEAAPAAPEYEGGCNSDRLLPEIQLNEARVLRGPLCESGVCVLRHSSIDPGNTRCTSRCITDRDCELMYNETTSCRSAPLLDRPDIFVSVCMPPMPW